MRVLAVQIRDHPGLGDFDVDFRGDDGRAARLVVVAGENGCGKTAVLEAIFAALAPTELVAGDPRRLAPGRYLVMLETDVANASSAFTDGITPEIFHEVRARYPGFDGLVIEINASWVERHFHKYYRLSDNTATEGRHLSTDVLGTGFGCFYSEANISFDVPRVQTIGISAGGPPSHGAPMNEMFPVLGGSALAKEVAQLLVDLQAADDAEVARWLDRNEGRPPDEIRNRRIRLFTEAFSRVVPRKRYVGVDTTDGEHRVIFEENGFRTALADLSTGEKQIVFRGAFLLRRSEDLSGAVALIDEPELSLHPRWQENVLSFYDNIMAEVPGRSSQVIVATHSPFVVHGSPTAKHVVLRRDPTSGRVEVDPHPSYPDVTTADVAVAAFDLSGFVRDARGKRLALIVEGPTDRTILEEAWRKLYPQRAMPFTVRSADGAKNIPRLLGAGGGKSGPLLDALSGTGTVLVGLFDFDQEGHAQWNGAIGAANAVPITFADIRCQPRKRRDLPIWAALLPVPNFRSNYASQQLGGDSRLTIELLFPDCHVEAYLDRIAVAGDGTASRLTARTDAQKGAVAAAVVNLAADAFSAFEPIFALLAEISGTK
jgi:ABC-type cobalamin/Fe3+-siderophores transport system ATPase subunit